MFKIDNNKFKFQYKYLFIILLISTLYACQQDLNIEIKTNDKRLLVDGEFTSDTIVHSIRLYCSGSLITGKPQTSVSGAKIIVTDMVDTIYYTENKDTMGLYQTPYKCYGKSGHAYTLIITNVDIDNDGKTETYTSSDNTMPVPVVFDSLTSTFGYNGDGRQVVNLAYYQLNYHSPDYLYSFTLINNSTENGTVTKRLGTGEFARFESSYQQEKVLNPETTLSASAYYAISPSKVKKGDTISFIGFNLTQKQYSFLKEFDANTSGDDPFMDNIYDQLEIPSNISTNIEPSDKAAGYFFVYSVSKISKIFNE
jgi:hypothetical protein